MSGIIQYAIDSKYLLGILFIVVLLMIEYIRYSKRQYYSNDFKKNPNMKNHILNQQFKIHKVNTIDVDEINLTIFLATSLSIVIGGVIMMFNIFVGILSYVVFSSLSVYYTNKYIVKKYNVAK